MRSLAAALASVLVLYTPARSDQESNDPLGACDRAATGAERRWHMPAGLLAAIGTVESGRGGLGSARPVAWPWSINAAGRGFFRPSKEAAIMLVRAMQASGLRTIDVGCFQVDLFYHPDAFATLEDAFNADANAEAAARILTRSRFGSGSWETAIALYHSASPMLGGRYLLQVQAVWPWARARTAAAAEDGPGAYGLISPAAQLVRVIGADEPTAMRVTSLPRVIGPGESASVVQWTAVPRRDLPRVETRPWPAQRAAGGKATE